MPRNRLVEVNLKRKTFDRKKELERLRRIKLRPRRSKRIIRVLKKRHK